MGYYPRVYTGGGGGAYYSQNTAPGGTINEGDRWFNTDTGIEYVYVYDDTSYQWIQPKPTSGPSLVMGTVELTVAQLAANATSYTVIGLEAPGVGKAWDVVSAVVRRTGGSGVLYTGSTLDVNVAGGIGTIFRFSRATMETEGSYIVKGYQIEMVDSSRSNLVENAEIQVTTQAGELTVEAQDYTVKIYVTAYLIDIT
jgi:hypothetical protein